MRFLNKTHKNDHTSLLSLYIDILKTLISIIRINIWRTLPKKICLPNHHYGIFNLVILVDNMWAPNLGKLSILIFVNKIIRRRQIRRFRDVKYLAKIEFAKFCRFLQYDMMMLSLRTAFRKFCPFTTMKVLKYLLKNFSEWNGGCECTLKWPCIHVFVCKADENVSKKAAKRLY